MSFSLTNIDLELGGIEWVNGCHKEALCILSS